MSDYVVWLLDRVGVIHGRYRNYISLMNLLLSTTYEYAFEMDGNRAKAGENLRSIFALEAGLYLEDTFDGPCTVLEMLIALSDNLAFDTNDSTEKWFWEILSNLGIANQDDEHFDENYIYRVLVRWMNHQYEENGNGSLFPLNHPINDCRNMEVWDQKNAYLVEKYPVGNWIE